MWQHRWALWSGALGATASCLVKMGVTTATVATKLVGDGEATNQLHRVLETTSPIDWFRINVCEQQPWLVDLDVVLLRGIYRVLGDLMVHYRINLMKEWRAVRNILDGVALQLHLFEVDYCQVATLPLRLLCIVGMVVMNAYMVASFLRGMKESGSVVGVALSTASNFVVSAIYGAVIWNEAMNATWYVGFACVLVGVMILSNVQSTSATTSTDSTVVGGGKSGETKEQYCNGKRVQTNESSRADVQRNSKVLTSKNGKCDSLASGLPTNSPSAEADITPNNVASLKKVFTPMPLTKLSPLATPTNKKISSFIPVTPSPYQERVTLPSAALVKPAMEASNLLMKPVRTVKNKEALKSESKLRQFHSQIDTSATLDTSSTSKKTQQELDQPLRTPLIDRSFVNECVLCEGPLFDVTTGKSLQDGYAAIADLAPLTCFHIFHAKCLKQCSKAYGNACPVCDKPLAMWHTAKQAASFPGFWLPRVERCLRAISNDDQISQQPRQHQHLKGSEPSPPTTCLPALVLRDYFRQDPTLTEEQKAYIQDDPTGMGKGLQVALEWGGYRDYNDVPKGHVGFAKCLRTKGIWKYDPQKDDLWLWEWGPIHPRQRCDQCQLVKRPLPIECQGCCGSAEAAFYCSETCAKRDWQRHRQTCQKWKEQGPTK